MATQPPTASTLQRRAPRRTGRDGGRRRAARSSRRCSSRCRRVRARGRAAGRTTATPRPRPGCRPRPVDRDAEQEAEEVELPERLHVAQAEKRRRDQRDRAGEHGARPNPFRQTADQRAGQRHGEQQRPAHRREGVAAPAHLRHHRLQEHGEDVASEPQSHLADQARDQHQPAAVGRHAASAHSKHARPPPTGSLRAGASPRACYKRRHAWSPGPPSSSTTSPWPSETGRCSTTCRAPFPPGGISVILGGSGSGKSTLLRLIGGLDPAAGRAHPGRRRGRHAALRARALPRAAEARHDVPGRRAARLDDRLRQPGLPAARARRGCDEPAIAAAVHDRLEAVGLRDVDGLLPGQLSGGMVKRVALARAIIRSRPSCCATSRSRGSTRSRRGASRRCSSTSTGRAASRCVVVSHDIASTMRMAEQVLLLLPGGAVSGRARRAAREHRSRASRAFLSHDARRGARRCRRRS